MRKKAKIFSPDTIKTRICQAVRRDMGTESQVYPDSHGVFSTLQTRLGSEIDKKYVSIEEQDESLDGLAKIKFLFTNMHMSEYDQAGLDLPSHHQVRPQSRYSPRHNIMLRARAICASILTPFDEDEWFLATKHGTGTSIGVPFMDTSLEAKSRLPMSVTKNAIPILERYQNFDNQLKSAVIAYNSQHPIGAWYETVRGSRATTVAKSAKINRMIAIEPTGNMFLQQGLMRMMYVRLKRAGLDVETLPTLHQERARIASITSKEATIDWSSASDCVSIELLRWLIPPKWFECCSLVRSPAIDIDGDLVDMNMFSTMGNAVTFPLETLVFYSLAIATYVQSTGTLSHFPEWEDRHRCSVFGDDCIVPTDIANDFIQIMTSVGFIINKEKSFIGDEGFRESCGGDYLHGYDNRPFSLKSPTSVRRSALEPWLYIIGNRLIAKYMMCFGTRNYIYNREFFSVLFELFVENDIKIKIVPDDYPDDAGLKIMYDFERFDFHFSPNWSRVAVNEHGLHTFLYTRFKYRVDANKFEELHYCTWLKTRASTTVLPLQREEQLLRLYRVRRDSFASNLRRLEHLPLHVPGKSPWRTRKVRGGYVVARGYSINFDRK